MNTHPKSSTAKRPPFLAFVNDEATMETCRALAAKNGWPEEGVKKGDIDSAALHLQTSPSPHLLVVDVPDAKTAPAAFDRLADLCEPGTHVLATGGINEYSFYTWLLEIGISQYLLKPVSEEALAQAVKRVSAPTAPAASEAAATKIQSQVIAVIGTRGGVGATTLSVNLASVIAEDLKQKTVLIDLDPQQGTVAMALDLEPGRGLRDALEKPDRIDSLFLERVMVRYSDHLSVLSTEEALDDPIHSHDDAVPTLIREIQAKSGVILLDLPRSLHRRTRSSLKLADHVVLVTELTLAGLRDALRISDYLRDVLKVKPPLVVANRVGLAPKHEMSRGDFEKGINGKLAALVPFEVDVFAAGTAGDLLIEKHKNSQTLKQVRMLAGLLLPEAGAPTEAKKPKGFALFRKEK